MSLISRLLIGLLAAVLALLSGCEVQKEGVKTVQVQLSLDHQDAAGRSLSRTGSRNENLTQGVRTELVLALSAAIGVTKNYRALDPQDSGLSNLLDSTVSLNLPLNTSLRLAVFRFRDIYSAAQLKAQLRNFDSYGFSAPFTLSASQSDLTVEITILPNGTPAVVVSRLDGTVSESGSQATFTVSLATAPKQDVQIPLTVSDTSEGSVSPTPLTFTPVNWFTTQTVTVTGKDDFVDDDNVTWTVRLGSIVSLDTDYNGMNPTAVSVTTADNDTADLESGLVAHYTLDNNTLDHSKLDGNFQDGSFPGGTSNPSATTGRDNTTSGAYEFTPSSTTSGDYISVAHSTTLAPTSAITVSLWAHSTNWQSLCNGISRLLLSKTHSGGYNLGCYQNTIRFQLRVRSGYKQRTYSVTNLTSGWHHIVGTYDQATGKQFLYLDGTAVDNVTTSGAISYQYNNSLIIGGEAGSDTSPDAGNGSYQFWQGRLDDVRIYNRALSANEVFDLYFEPTRSLAAYYPLAGNGNDLSGNSYHGTLGSGNSEPSVTTGHSGLNAQAYSFDGTDDYIALNKYVSPNSISSTTVCVWAKSTNQSKDKYLISFDRSESWRLALHDDQGGNNVGWDTTQYGGTTNNLNTSLSYEDGQWHHICGWYEAGKAPDKKIYVDGTLVKSSTAHGGSNLGTSYRTKHYGYLGWGSKSGSFNDQTTSTHPDDFMQGSIDDVRIYDRALSDNEISALYSVADKHPPLPGNSGTLAASNVSSSGLTLTWTKATDDITDNASLQYKVVRADSDRIRTPETAERNGTLVQNWTVNFDNVSVSGLSASTAYYFTVLVRDNASNVASYQTTSAAASSADAASATINWGTNANYQDVVVYTVNKGADTLGTINDYSSFCASKGKSYIASGYPASGNSYSSSNTPVRFFLPPRTTLKTRCSPACLE